MGHHLSGHDVVPSLRADLEPLPEPTGIGEELITLAPVEGAGAMRMHGFELQLARMLDGRRTANEVVANAKKLGLPIALDDLEDFIFQLKAHRLIGTEPRPDGRTWPLAARDLFGDALKAAREGQFDAARAHLDAMRELVDADEARSLRRWLDTHDDPLTAGSTFGANLQQAVDAWEEDAPRHWSHDVRHTLRRTWWPVFGPITAIGFLIAYVLLPRPHWVTTVADLSPLEVVTVAAPAAATVDELMVREGEYVEAGQPLFTFAAGPKAGKPAAERKGPEDQAAARTVRAPRAGVVSRLTAQSGGELAAGERVLELAQVDRMKMTAPLTGRNAASVAVGTPITVRIGHERLQTSVSAVSAGTITAELPNPGGALAPGPLAVQLQVPPRPKRL